MSQVITYKNEGAKGVYSQIKLDSGERVLISIAANEIKIFKLRFFGIIPSQTVWEFSDLFQFANLLQKNRYSDHPLDVLVEKAKGFSNIEQLQKELKIFVTELKSKKDFQLFENAYALCVKQPNKYLSDNFKKYIDKLLPKIFFENPLRTPMITGYYLRCAETVLNQKKMGEPDEQIDAILKSDKNTDDKIEEIANYLDNHDKIGLSEKIATYSLIPFEDTHFFFEVYAEDFINHTQMEKKLKKDKLEIFYELAYRNMAFGYLYKLSEELTNKIKK